MSRGPRTIRAALYGRVSTTGHGQDVRTQTEPLQAAAEQRGWSVVEVYTDIGISGAKETRPALDRMMTAARAGQVDVVCVWKLDRLGRSLSHLLRVLDELHHLGVQFVSLGDPGIDTTSPQGRLLLQLLGVFSEFERGLIRQRVNAGLDRARRQGKRLGRPERDVDVARARALLAEGRTQRQVAMALRVPRSTLRRALGRGDGLGPKSSPKIIPSEAVNL